MNGATWLEAFRSDPDRAVDDLFSGRAGVEASLRLDAVISHIVQIPGLSRGDEDELSRFLMHGVLAGLGLSVPVRHAPEVFE